VAAKGRQIDLRLATDRRRHRRVTEEQEHQSWQRGMWPLHSASRGCGPGWLYVRLTRRDGGTPRRAPAETESSESWLSWSESRRCRDCTVGRAFNWCSLGRIHCTHEYNAKFSSKYPCSRSRIRVAGLPVAADGACGNKTSAPSADSPSDSKSPRLRTPECEPSRRRSGPGYGNRARHERRRVGKSTVAANLASRSASRQERRLARRRHVRPSVPTMFGISGRPMSRRKENSACTLPMMKVEIRLFVVEERRRGSRSHAPGARLHS